MATLWPSSWLAHGQDSLRERGSMLLVSPCICGLHTHMTHTGVILTLPWEAARRGQWRVSEKCPVSMMRVNLQCWQRREHPGRAMP